MIFGYEKKNWPLCILTIEGKPNSENVFKQFLNEWSLLYEESKVRNQRFNLFIDVRGVSGVDIKYMIILGKYLISVKNLTEKWMNKTAILVSNKSIKNLIKFVFTLYKPIRPFKVFNEADKSLEWLLNNEKGDTENSL